MTDKNQKYYFQKKIIGLLILILSTGFFIFNFSCSKKIDPEDVVVARVGNDVITVGEFRRNYEFGLPHLKKGSDWKASYLDFMIKEKILSLEGYKLNLDNSKRVQQLENELLDELLVEELFIKEVHDKIKISPDDIREAVNKSKISWKLRYWVEPTLGYANSVCQAMRQRGYSAVLEDIMNSNPEVELKPKDFESDYITWLEAPPEMLEAIKYLPVGEISDPIKLNGVYFIFQILDIRRKGVLEIEYADKAESFRKILFYRQAAEDAARFVSEFMTPKNVTTKGDAFITLADGLAEWKKKDKNKRKDFLEAIKNAEETEPSLFKLKKDLKKNLVNFEGGKWTTENFIKRLDTKAVKIEPENKDQFRSQLNQEIALEVRNHFFTKEAKKRKLQKSKNVKQQLQVWRDKWVYDEMRRKYTKDVKIKPKQAKKYFDKYKDRYKIRADDTPTYGEFKNQAKRDAYIQTTRALLNKKIDALKKTFPVTIYQNVLDTITVVDSKKSRWMSLQVFKRSSGRLAHPLVDPAWGF
ncbi:peptidyl-prolyl cis-trans isomerase [candidate division KSB1 bacterium]|nr:peptidyl-prolyl cis-trans isomerase [candidate division KSB1 bacterium]